MYGVCGCGQGDDQPSRTMVEKPRLSRLHGSPCARQDLNRLMSPGLTNRLAAWTRRRAHILLDQSHRLFCVEQRPKADCQAPSSFGRKAR